MGRIVNCVTVITICVAIQACCISLIVLKKAGYIFQHKAAVTAPAAIKGK